MYPYKPERLQLLCHGSDRLAQQVSAQVALQQHVVPFGVHSDDISRFYEQHSAVGLNGDPVRPVLIYLLQVRKGLDQFDRPLSLRPFGRNIHGLIETAGREWL
jgi:hypothetical protein